MRVTRRGILIGAGIVGGGMVLGTVGLASYVAAYDQRSLQRSALQGSKLITQWIAIAPDGRVTLHGPHTEMGQGTQTSLLQILLDEMDCDPATTGHELAPADPAFTLAEMMQSIAAELGGLEFEGWTGGFIKDALGRGAQLANMQFTGGSLAVRSTGWVGIRRAAASARMMLALAGAEALGAPVSEVRTENSRVHHNASGKSIGYGELAEAASQQPMPTEPVFKDPANYRFIGKPFPRIDLPEKVFGQPVYGIDVEVPGMRYAAVAPPPLAQGRVTGVTNEAEVKKLRGVEAVVVMDDCVAVVADNPWRAEQAVRQLKIECDPPEGGPIDHEAHEELRIAAVREGGREVISRGDGVSSIEGDDVIEALYLTPYFAHMPMEPMNATVWEEDGKHHVATGTQGPLNTRRLAADTLGRRFRDVVLHAKTMGGGFGRRNALVSDSINWVKTACRIQKAVGGAVKMTWSREAGLRMSTYHPADAGLCRARLDSDGNPEAWLIDAYHPGIPLDESLPPYKVPHVTFRSVGAEPVLPFGYWRSVANFTMVYFHECFMDELAQKAGKDPLEYRLGLVKDERSARVLRRAAELAQYKGRVVGDHGFGIAFIEGFGSKAAAVIEVSLEGARPRVHNAWCAVDCAIPVNPGSVEAQTQGALFWGVSAALYGDLQFDKGAMVQSNFHNYRVATFWESPRIHVDVLRSPEAPIGGVGELATPLAAPAIANAVAALTERRRSLPLVG